MDYNAVMVHEGSSPSFPTIQRQWYNFIMENVLDQEQSDPEIIRAIVEEITSEQPLDSITKEDYTKVDESSVVWAAI